MIQHALKLTRPFNCLSSFSGVLIGGFLVNPSDSIPIWVAGFVAALITAGGNVVNDYFDIEIDRINKPTRILPSGKLSKNFAAWYCIVLFGVALLISLTLGKVMAAFATLMIFLSLIYSSKLKKSFLLGNLVIGIMTAATFYYGSAAAGHLLSAWSPPAIVFIFMVGREVLKTAEDYDGDLKVNARTVAINWGKKTSSLLFSGLMVIVILLIPIPWINGDVSYFYMLLTIPLVDFVLIGSILILFIHPGKDAIHKALFMTKASWLSWAVAMFVGLWLKP